MYYFRRKKMVPEKNLFNTYRIVTVPYESPILGQLLELISPVKINLFEPRFKSYDSYDMAN